MGMPDHVVVLIYVSIFLSRREILTGHCYLCIKFRILARSLKLKPPGVANKKREKTTESCKLKKTTFIIQKFVRDSLPWAKVNFIQE